MAFYSLDHTEASGEIQNLSAYSSPTALDQYSSIHIPLGTRDHIEYFVRLRRVWKPVTTIFRTSADVPKPGSHNQLTAYILQLTERDQQQKSSTGPFHANRNNTNSKKKDSSGNTRSSNDNAQSNALETEPHDALETNTANRSQHMPKAPSQFYESTAGVNSTDERADGKPTLNVPPAGSVTRTFPKRQLVLRIPTTGRKLVTCSSKSRVKSYGVNHNVVNRTASRLHLAAQDNYTSTSSYTSPPNVVRVASAQPELHWHLGELVARSTDNNSSSGYQTTGFMVTKALEDQTYWVIVDVYNRRHRETIPERRIIQLGDEPTSRIQLRAPHPSSSGTGMFEFPYAESAKGFGFSYAYNVSGRFMASEPEQTLEEAVFQDFYMEVAERGSDGEMRALLATLDCNTDVQALFIRRLHEGPLYWRFGSQDDQLFHLQKLDNEATPLELREVQHRLASTASIPRFLLQHGQQHNEYSLVWHGLCDDTFYLYGPPPNERLATQLCKLVMALETKSYRHVFMPLGRLRSETEG